MSEQLKKPTAYSYIRMSTQKQLKGDSLRRQLELSDKYCQNNGLELDTSISLQDIGVSAYTGENLEKKKLGEFLKLIEKKEIKEGSYLLVESLDRLSRSIVFDALQLFISILNAGIIIVTLSDNEKFSKESVEKDYTRLIYTLTIMSRAHEESKEKSRRVKASWDNKRSNLTNKILTAVCPAWLKVDSDKKKFEIDLEKKKIIKQIYNDSLNGMGNHAITKRLNRNGTPTWSKAKEWNPSYIHKILTSRATLGEFQPMKKEGVKRVPAGEVIPNYFPRMISDQLFYKVQSARSTRNYGGGKKGPNMSNLFSKIAVCGYCGASMHYVDKSRSNIYFICSNARLGLGCKYISWRYSDFETSLLTLVQQLNIQTVLKNDSDRENLIQQLTEEKDIELIKKRETEIKIERLLNALEESGTSSDSVMKRIAEYETEQEISEENIKILDKKIGNEMTEQVDLVTYQLTITETLKAMVQLEGDEQFELRSKLAQNIRNLVEKIEVFPCSRRLPIDEEKRFEERLMKKSMEHLKNICEEENWSTKKFSHESSIIKKSFISRWKKLNSKDGRNFAVLFRSGYFIWIQPDFNNPTQWIAKSEDHIEELNGLTPEELKETKLSKLLWKEHYKKELESILTDVNGNKVHQPTIPEVKKRAGVDFAAASDQGT